jgi:nicotinate-nucleotide--dimethylbenzimidazole phosphoribosyltransferase
MNIDWLDVSAKTTSLGAFEQARKRQDQLTKPPGSLGRLEACAITLAGMQDRPDPQLNNIRITVFAADHGVANAGVSAFPQQVTGQMVANFAAGGAAISVLARSLGAELEVVDVGTVNGPVELLGVISDHIGPGTADFSQQDAMTQEQLEQALNAGRASALRAIESGAEIYIGGDMGIANTTAAAALSCALLPADPEELAGPGTGLDTEGVSHKAQVIAAALSRYQGLQVRPLEALRCLGGFEIAALVGAYITCAQHGLPVLVDGYITSAAALVAVRHQPTISEWLLFSHRSAEPGHRAILQGLVAEPLLDLGMRLGEGSGAAVAVPLLRLACDLHNGMSTFADAGVSER